MRISEVSYERLQAEHADKGWPFYTSPYDLNLFAVRVRPEDRVPDAWKCRIGVAYRTDLGPALQMWTCSTLPGVWWLRHPGRLAGTAIIRDGYYRSVFEAGRYHGKAAMLQVGPMDYYRDADYDGIPEPGGAVETSRINGTHWHVGGGEIVGKDSAGCVASEEGGILVVQGLLILQRKAGHGARLSFALHQET